MWWSRFEAKGPSQGSGVGGRWEKLVLRLFFLTFDQVLLMEFWGFFGFFFRW